VPSFWARRVDYGHFVFPKMDIVCESYRVLMDFPNKKKSQLVKVNSQQVVLLMSVVHHHDVSGDVSMKS
jgi:hypothetical protein